MNYSQRKHIERLIANSAAPFDTAGLRVSSMFAGVNIIDSPDVPRYTLPAEVLPGVPWPPGFRDDINSWSRSFLGTTNALPRGTVYMLGGGIAVMRPDDIVKLSNICG